MCKFTTLIRAMMTPSLDKCYLKGLRAGLKARDTKTVLNSLRLVLLFTIKILYISASPLRT
jgi:hypothetical protein